MTPATKRALIGLAGTAILAAGGYGGYVTMPPIGEVPPVEPIKVERRIDYETNVACYISGGSIDCVEITQGKMRVKDAEKTD